MARSKPRKINKKLQHLIRLADEYRQARISQDIHDGEFILLTLADPGESWIATTRPHPDEGLMLYRAVPGYGYLLDRWDAGRDPSGFDGIDVLTLGYAPLRNIDPGFRRTLEAAGVRGDGSRLAPEIHAKDARQLPRLPRAAELRVITAALEGILDCHRAGSLLPLDCFAERDRIFEIRFGAANKVVASGPIDVPESLGHRPLPPRFDGDDELRTLPRRSVTFGVVAFPMSTSLPPDAPNFAVAAVVESGDIISQEPMINDDPDAVANALCMAFEGEDQGTPGLPDEVVFQSRPIFEALRADLANLDVDAVWDPDHPVFDCVADHQASMIDLLNPEMPENPETDADWCLVDRAMTLKIGKICAELDTPRARARFFDLPPGPDVCEELPDGAALPSYFEWLVGDDRPSGRSTTYAEEQLLRDDLSEPERAFWASRQNAVVSLYRVESVFPDQHLLLVDIVGGGEISAFDPTLSDEDFVGCCLVLRLCPVEGCYFPRVLIPPMNGLQDSLLEWIGTLDLGPGGLRDHVPALTRWWLDTLPKMPELPDLDVRSFEFRKVEFSVGDRGSLLRALQARPDIQAGEEPSTWEWRAPGEIPPPVGLNCLGHLELDGDRLFLETHSAEHLEAARYWLEQIEDVQLVEANEPYDPSDMQTVADALASAFDFDDETPPPPAVVRQIVPRIRSRILGWADEPAPALDNRTPRETCQTEEGKARVARLVNAMPQPIGPGIADGGLDFEGLREELLRDLEIITDAQRRLLDE